MEAIPQGEHFNWRQYSERVLEDLAEGILIAAADGHVLYANTSAARILGVEKTALLVIDYPDTPWLLFTPEGRRLPDAERPLFIAITTGRPRYNVELILERSDGSRAALLENAVPLRDEVGKPLGAVLSFYDITERKRLGDELAEGIERFSSLIESTTDAIIGCTGGGFTVSFWNTAAERMFGYTKEEIVGKPLSYIIPERLREEHRRGVTRFIAEGRAIYLGKTMEFEGLRKGGSEFPMEISLGAWRRKEETLFVAVIRDITERKRTEAERSRLLRELERRTYTLQAVMERTNSHIAYLDRDFGFLMVNSAYAEGSGYTSEQLVGRNHFELFPNAENQALFERVRDTGEPIEFKAKPFEFPAQPERGITYWDWTLTPIKDASGHAGLVLSLFDVTENVKARKLSEELNRINVAITSTLSFDEIMRRVVTESAKAIGSEAAAIEMREETADFEERWLVRYAYGLPDQQIGRPLTGEAPAITAMAARERQTIAVNDAYSDERVDREVMKDYGIRSFLAVPLLVREAVIGVLVFYYYSRRITLREEEVDFGRKLGTAVSLALENVRLFGIERDIAGTLQEALLTMPERISGIDYAYLYRSAQEAVQVGGDFYDLFDLEHRKVGIVIGDVSGHGLEGATLTALVRNTIKAYVFDEESPAAVMAKVNEVVRRSTPGSLFVTVFFGILDTRSGRFIYCNAGHPQPMIAKANGDTFLTDVGSPIIGAFANMPYFNRDAVLEKGDLLVLYTDGVFEARINAERLGQERLIEYVRGLSRPSAPKAAMKSIFDFVTRLTGGKFSDDLAILCIGLDGKR
ncbi:MAG: SpoIIE family protein phosphatase [Candidatus Aquicultorales bacterium]